jgi:hypothetical protein
LNRIENIDFQRNVDPFKQRNGLRRRLFDVVNETFVITLVGGRIGSF